MPLSPQEWHKRFSWQARWTRDLRQYLYSKAGIDQATRILEVGSGTGALFHDFRNLRGARIHALDLDSSFLKTSRQVDPKVLLVQGDGHHLPFDSRTFEICLCHFFLLWVKNPTSVVGEMRRVTRQGGSVLAFAEPNYSARIDYPEELAEFGAWQIESLLKQGADPTLGRRLAELFVGNQINLIEVGVLGGRWDIAGQIGEFASEMEIIQHDLSYLSLDDLEMRSLESLKAIDLESRKKGFRILFVPTFYAWGRVD
jgi:ubiquinone/menaquinone biosynthesis C-methylase UbiE